MESQLCEEFHCLPSQLEREDPERLFTIAGLRSYARTKQALDTAKDSNDIKHTSLVDRVFDIQQEIMRDRMAKRGA